MMDHLHLHSPVEVMTERFLEDRCCKESDLKREIVVASIPYIVICIALGLYIALGAAVFSELDDFMEQETFASKCLFIFTTLATIGYGNFAPENTISKWFCVIYVSFGVPLLLLALANFGQLFSELFWTCVLIVSPGTRTNPESRRSVPLSVAAMFLLFHSIIGGIIFSCWLHKLPFSTAIYFSFVSITTIGYGDIVVTPKDNFGTVIMTLYLIGGIIIMSMFINAMVEYIEWIHYLGRKPTTFLSNVIWFGGESMTVQQLVQLAAASFEISPQQLRATIKNLDQIIALALEGELRKKSKIMIMYDNLWNKNTFARQNRNKFKEVLKSTSSLSRWSVRSHEKEIIALKVLYDNLGGKSSP